MEKSQEKCAQNLKGACVACWSILLVKHIVFVFVLILLRRVRSFLFKSYDLARAHYLSGQAEMKRKERKQVNDFLHLPRRLFKHNIYLLVHWTFVKY